MNQIQEAIDNFFDYLVCLGIDPSGLQPRQNQQQKLFFDDQEIQSHYEIFVSIYKKGFKAGRQHGIDLSIASLGKLL